MENNGNPSGYKDLLSAALGESGVTDDLDEFAADLSGFSSTGYGSINIVPQVGMPAALPTAGRTTSGSPFLQVQKTPLCVANTISQQNMPGNVVQANGGQFRRVIIKTPQGQKQMLQRIVTTAAHTSNPALGHVINTQGQKTLISQQVNTPVGGAKVVARTPKGLVTANMNTRIQNVSGTPQQTVRALNSPKVVTVPQYNGRPNQPTVTVVRSQLPNSATGFDQIGALAKPGLSLTNAVTSSGTSPMRSNTPQGTPKIVTVRQMTPNTGQSPVLVNNKGEQLPVRVIKVAKTDGGPVQRPVTPAGVVSTANSGPRIVKIMTTPRGSSPLTTGGQVQTGVRRVIMQSFTKSQTSSTDSMATVVPSAKGSQLSMLQSPQTVKSGAAGQVTVVSHTIGKTSEGDGKNRGVLNIVSSSTTVPQTANSVTTVTHSPIVPLTSSACDIRQNVTLTASSVNSTLGLTGTSQVVSGRSLVSSPVTVKSATAATTVLPSNKGTSSVALTTNTNPVVFLSKSNVQTSSVPSINISSGNSRVNMGTTKTIQSNSNLGPVNTVNASQVAGTTDKSVKSEVREAPASPEVIVIDDNEDEVSDKKQENVLIHKVPEKVNIYERVENSNGANKEISVQKSVKVRDDYGNETESKPSLVNGGGDNQVKEQSDKPSKATVLQTSSDKDTTDTSKRSEGSSSEQTIPEVKTSKSPAPAAGNEVNFGDLFGDDNPFFQALAQLQDTNKKAKEFEEKVKAGKVEDQDMDHRTPMDTEAGSGLLDMSTSSVPSISASTLGNKTHSMHSGNDLLSLSQAESQQSAVISSVQGMNTQAFFKPLQTAPVTVLSEGQGPGSTAGLLQRIPSPLNVQIKGNQVVQRDSYSPPAVIANPVGGGRVNSPVTIVQRVSSPLGVSGAGTPGSTQMFRVVTQGLASGGTTTPTVKYITTPRSQQGHVSMGMSVNTPLRSVQSAPRMLPMSVQRDSVQIGQKFTIGHDGVQRLIPNNPTDQLPSKLTDRDVSRLWVNDDLKLRNIQQEMSRSESPGGVVMTPGGMTRVVEEEVEEEEEELGIAETYAEYMPAKLKVGQRHPDPVVESSSLSSVEPQDVYYSLNIPEHIIDYGSLSALQLETITYCCQKHQNFLPSGQRAGFLIGDGAGVGKGRTIAGIIYENYLQGRKRSLWMSVSNDLRVDAERDLRDIGASKVEVHPLNKFKYAKISSSENGKVKKGVIFATYSSLIGESSAKGKYRTRFKQLIHWLGKDFDGLIVFDECHRAKNLCPVGSSKPTKTGLTVLELQNKLPKARVVYASATGASEPRNMAYMTRLGLWGPGTPFKEFMDFILAVEKRGVGAMELVAMDMKLRGMYIARQLSFKGVSFRIENVPISKEFSKVYNDSVKLWVEARDAFQKASALMGSEQRTVKTMWGQFWSSHQRFFKYLCIHAKLDHCVKIARQAVKSGKCVVIGLQSTGEARTMEQLEEYGEITDFVSTAKGVLQSLIDRHFPAPNRKKAFDFSSLFEDSVDSFKVGSKRKKDFTTLSQVKRRKEDWSDSDSDSDSNDKKVSEPSGGKGSSDKSDQDSDIPSEDDESEEESEPEDFNPFGSGDDSDDDPWLKKAKRKEKKKSKPKKEEKKEKKKSRKEKKKQHAGGNSDDEFNNIDSMFDKALQAAGLKSSKINEHQDIPGSAPALSIGADDIDKAAKLKEKLLAMLDALGDSLPPNTLDQLIDDLGGTECVAEMTGRKGRVVTTDDGSIQYESRSEQDIPLEIMNLAEKQRFMDGEKYIAVISEAASSGISLQADRRAINQRRRVHITLELPWSADRAIQQFGRTHRSNQVSGPEYIFLISSLAGERRFASTVSKRLESLGALTHGDRRATDTRDLSQFNIDNKYGKTALESTLKSVMCLDQPLVPPPSLYKGNFFHDAKQALIGVGLVTFDERYGVCSLEKDYSNISKFLNRILGFEVELQNHLFQYFTDTLAAICMQAKRNGRWDMGILDLGSTGESVKRLETKTFVGTFSGSKTKIELNTVSVERGTTYSDAMRVWHEHSAPDDGFYLANQDKNGKRAVLLATLLQGKNKDRLYNVYKPNTGLQSKAEAISEIKRKYKKVLPEVARPWWLDQFTSSATQCSHAYWKGSCRRASLGGCEVGLRSRQYYILSGSVLSVWSTVERVLATTPGNYASRMQIIRLRTDEGKKIVGTLIPHNAVQSLTSILSQESRIYNTQHAQSLQQAHTELASASSLLNHTPSFSDNQSAFASPTSATQSQFAQIFNTPSVAPGTQLLKHHASSPASLSHMDSMSSVKSSHHRSGLNSTVGNPHDNHGNPYLSMPTSLF